MKLKINRALLLLLAFCFITISLLCGTPEAKAANSDFSVSYEVSPNPVGPLGADVNLVLIVENTGPTDITWVRVDIGLSTPYTKKWSGSPAIDPGDTRRLTFVVPLTSEDLNVARSVSVSMNNDGDSMQDGDTTFAFTVHSQDVFTVTSTISPAGPYFPGDTVTVTTQYHNNMTKSATGVAIDNYLKQDGTKLVMPPTTHFDVIASGGTKTTTVTYTLQHEDIGEVGFYYELRVTMMGRDYQINGFMLNFNVAALVLPTFVIEIPDASSEPEHPEVDFTAELRADRTEIDSGDLIDFWITIRNTGEDDIDSFEIRNADGDTEKEGESLGAGYEGSALVSKRIYETCDIGFTVVGRTGDITTSRETNSVHITVREAAETASAAVSAVQSTAAESAAVTETVKPASSQPGEHDMLYLLIIILALIIIAGIVVIVILTARRRKE